MLVRGTHHAACRGNFRSPTAAGPDVNRLHATLSHLDRGGDELRPLSVPWPPRRVCSRPPPESTTSHASANHSRVFVDQRQHTKAGAAPSLDLPRSPNSTHDRDAGRALPLGGELYPDQLEGPLFVLGLTTFLSLPPLRSCICTARSDTNRLSRPFSFSSERSRCAAFPSMPPYCVSSKL